MYILYFFEGYIARNKTLYSITNCLSNITFNQNNFSVHEQYRHTQLYLQFVCRTLCDKIEKFDQTRVKQLRFSVSKLGYECVLLMEGRVSIIYLRYYQFYRPVLCLVLFLYPFTIRHILPMLQTKTGDPEICGKMAKHIHPIITI